MRIGIIAEGFADVKVIKAIVRKLVSTIDSFHQIRPQEQFDETDLQELNFSNWQLVLESCKDEQLLSGFFDELEGEALIVVHIDTAERGEEGFDVNEPIRSKNMDFALYSEQLREQVRMKIEEIIPEQYRQRIAYAIAIEETDAWLIPLFENTKHDTASHVSAKETLSRLIGKDKKLKNKYIDTNKNNLDYQKLGKELSKELKKARSHNKSLDLFCLDIEKTVTEE